MIQLFYLGICTNIFQAACLFAITAVESLKIGLSKLFCSRSLSVFKYFPRPFTGKIINTASCVFVVRVGLNLNFELESAHELLMKLNLNLNSTFAKLMNLNLAFSKSMNLNLNLVFSQSMNLNLNLKI